MEVPRNGYLRATVEANPATNHPYYPPGLQISNYVTNKTHLLLLLQFLGSVITFAVSTSLYFALRKRGHRPFSRYDNFCFCWFVLCAFLHLSFEGFFILNHETIPGSQQLFAQLWKEYALSDSRYMTSDPFMLCIETLTVALWGPLCTVIAACIVAENRLRIPLEIIMCVGHLYGVLLYYGTCFSEAYYNGVSHSRPEALYYWVYFIGMNAPWVVVPSVILWKDINTVCRAMEALGTVESSASTLSVADVEGEDIMQVSRKD